MKPPFSLFVSMILAGSVVAGETVLPITQQAYLKASNAAMNDQFGWSGGISISEDTVVVGAPEEDSSAKCVDGDQGDGLDPFPGNPRNGFDSGAAYVFWRYGSGWSQQAYLKSSDTSRCDCFGRAVAVSGDTVVVASRGADGEDDGVPYHGAVYVFVRSGSTWTQQACLKVADSDMDNFGQSVAVCGNTVVVGADGKRSAPTGDQGDAGAKPRLMAGAAYVFVRTGKQWSQQACLAASKPEYKAHFGTTAAISGDTVVIGAIGESGDDGDSSASDAGAAYVFVRDGGSWRQQARLKAREPGEFAHFGSSVAISGDTVVVGAEGEGEGGASPEKAEKAATFDPNTDYSAATSVETNDEGDTSTERNGTAPYVPARSADSGAAYVFVRSGDDWQQQARLQAPELVEYGKFGCSVAVSGDRLVVGASGAGDPDDENLQRAGAAYVFVRNGSDWGRGTRIMASNPQTGDTFGGTVGISADTVAVGAALEDGVARGVNGNQHNESSANYDSGAAYVFTLSGDAGEGMTRAAAGQEGERETLEERIVGYWATNWAAMAESWQPLVEGLADLKAMGPGVDDQAAAEKAVIEEMEQGFGVMTVEIRKGQMIHHTYPGRPERATYTLKSQDTAAATLQLEVTAPGGTATTTRAVFDGDQLTLIEEKDEKTLPLILNRIDATTFEKRQKAAAESELFRDQDEPSPDPGPETDGATRETDDENREPGQAPDGHPVAEPIPRKPGYVFSPYNRKPIDVREIPAGTLLQDPTYPASEKKYFRLPKPAK